MSDALPGGGASDQELWLWAHSVKMNTAQGVHIHLSFIKFHEIEPFSSNGMFHPCINFMKYLKESANPVWSCWNLRAKHLNTHSCLYKPLGIFAQPLESKRGRFGAFLEGTPVNILIHRWDFPWFSKNHPELAGGVPPFSERNVAWKALGILGIPAQSQ